MSAKLLGKLLKRKREQLPGGMTQADIADAIGIKDFTTLSHWENGRRLMNHVMFVKLCAVCNLTIGELMETINEKDW